MVTPGESVGVVSSVVVGLRLGLRELPAVSG